MTKVHEYSRFTHGSQKNYVFMSKFTLKMGWTYIGSLSKLLLLYLSQLRSLTTPLSSNRSVMSIVFSNPHTSTFSDTLQNKVRLVKKMNESY